MTRLATAANRRLDDLRRALAVATDRVSDLAERMKEIEGMIEESAQQRPNPCRVEEIDDPVSCSSHKTHAAPELLVSAGYVFDQVWLD